MKSVVILGGLDTSLGAGIAMDARVAASLATPVEVCVTSLAVQSDTKSFHLQIADDVAIAERLMQIPRRSIGAAKLGALGSVALADRLSAPLIALRRPLVIDPVLRTTSGGALCLGSDEEIRSLYRRSLAPHAALLTPNLVEAEFLLRRKRQKFSTTSEIAQALEENCRCPVLLKGGHAAGNQVVDVFCRSGEVRLFRHPRLPGRGPRGTGCALATAIACALATGRSLEVAVALALAEHQRAMRRNRKGGGNSPAPWFIS